VAEVEQEQVTELTQQWIFIAVIVRTVGILAIMMHQHDAQPKTSDVFSNFTSSIITHSFSYCDVMEEPHIPS
jgi:hypothetical protein